MDTQKLAMIAFVVGLAVVGAERGIAAPVWPGDPGYTGDAYAVWINDGDDGLADKVDITSVEFARDTTVGNEYFFWRITVVDQAQQQLVGVAHAVFIDVDGDGTNEYVLYNTTTGGDVSELGVWDTSLTPDQWDTDASPPAYTYSGLDYTRDASATDNYIELALPAAHIGSPPVIFQAAALDTGALNMDGDTSNGPGASFVDTTAPSSGPVVPEPGTGLALLVLGATGYVMRRKRKSAASNSDSTNAA